MRLFLALELAPELAAALEASVAPLRAEVPEIAWVPACKRHLTLKFLGEVPDDQLARVVALADGVARCHRPFTMEIGGVGAFPNFRRARVVWTGVAQESRLELLHHDVEIAAAAAGHEIEGRAFRPHITLARVRTPLAEARARRLARAARTIDFSATQPVAEITLFESTRAGAGATYRRVHAATLGGA